MEDRERGTVAASFVRGEATKATATEIAALAAYTSSELGCMARERDGAIEQLVENLLADAVAVSDGQEANHY